MSKVLIFSPSATGHYLEYLHHLYVEAVRHPDTEYVFCVSPAFQSEKYLWSWPEAKNVSFDLLSAEDCSYAGGYLRRNFRFANALRKLNKKHRPQNIFLLDLMLCMPWLAFVVGGAVRISGIIYAIDHYRMETLTTGQRFFSHLMNWILAKSTRFSKLFLLNGVSESRYYNKIYSTRHFFPLSDPFCGHNAESEDYREKYHVAPGKKIFLHFGAMGRKKGTFLILDAISKLKKEELSRYCFVFAGRIREGEISEFENRIKTLPRSVQVLVFNEYCSYAFLENWCTCCDSILAPYLTTYASSGMLGYASAFAKPLLIVNHGFLPKLIKKYQLGVAIKEAKAELLAEGFSAVLRSGKASSRYARENDVDSFVGQLFVKDVLL